MGATLRCHRCGAHVPLPGELHVLTVRCNYCGLDQPVPDAAARQQALRQAQASAQIHAQIQRSVRSGQSMGKWIMIGTMLFVFIVFAITIAGMLGFSLQSGD